MKKMTVSQCWLRMSLLALVSASLLCLPASGQYFGQNKVRYNTFDFKVLKTEHFDIYYYPEEQKIIEQLGRMAERWYFRLSSVLDAELSSRQPVIFYADHPDFQQTVIIPGMIGETTGGVTESLRRRIAMPLAGSLGETDHVLGHELVHAFQYDLSSRAQKAGVGISLEGLPLWFIEGMAEYLSLGPNDPYTSMWMRDAVLREEMPPILELNSSKYFPYRWGQAVWSFIAGKYGDKALGDILKAAVKSGNPEHAISSALDVSMKELSEEWHQTLKDQYQRALRLTDPANRVGKVLLSKEKSGTELNVSPAISPDGRHMMIFSEKSLFSIDLFMVDAQNGKFLRKITKTAISPHFINLQFSNATGSWSSDGKQFAFARVKGAVPELSIYDIKEDAITHEIPIREAGEIYSVSWSPDGKAIAFAAIVEGISDLFAIDLESRRVDRLTNDEYSDLQPSWSPDGKKIAFVTDRFSTNLSNLSFGQFRLALLNMETGDITELRCFDTGKHINPQWSPDGSSVFFISDFHGIPNIYRIALDGGEISRVTNLATGVSGIGRFSPAFTIARNSGSLVLSVFNEGNYQVLRMESGQEPAGARDEPDLAGTEAGVLPPVKRTGVEVPALLQKPNEGLIGSMKFEKKDYKPGLQLEYISPASVSIGASSRYGALVGGGMGFYFGDILNYHELGIEVQTSIISGNHPLRNLSGVATYLNKRNRWTWGFSGGQIPYLSAGFSQGVLQANGQPVIVQSDTTYWQINRQILGLLQYPFSRAQRVEFSSGFQNLDFAASRDTNFYDYFTGEFLGSESVDLDTPDSLNMNTSSAALVYDTSLLGGVSPVAGQRYRLEGGLSAGSLVFATALADYRRYFQLARPLSLAGRLLHYGRYGSDAEDSLIQSLYLGYSSLVRGYESNSIEAAECGDTLALTGACPVVDRLVGSRIGVANVELRLELLGPLGIIPGTGGVPSVQVAPFFDAGVAWTKEDTPSFFGGDRKGVTSYGASFRFNIVGIAVGQLSLVHPNNRPLKGWFWEFSFLPGF
jgi:Tol biopolymer transport system component